MASLKDRLAQAASGQSSLDFDPLAADEARLAKIRIEDIELDSGQPRKDSGDLAGLVDSIREHGVIHPIVVQPLDNRRFRLVAGERRLRASQEAGLESISSLVRNVEERQRLAFQLTENLTRKDLDPFEEADGYQRLAVEFELTHTQISRKVGKSRTTVTETVALARIPAELREECRRADIPISRDTLYLMAKQETLERMREIFEDSQAGLPREARRERARKGGARGETEPVTKKPKQVLHTALAQVIIQGKTSEALSLEQMIQTLRDALDQLERRLPG